MSLSTSHNPLAVLDKARAGDDEALSALLQIYLPYLKLLARLNFSSRLSARIDASDLVQETALQVQRDLFQFRGKTEKELMAWFRRIMANTAAASMRHHTRRRRDIGNERAIQCRLDESSFMITEAMASPGSSPSQRVGRRERAVLLAEAVVTTNGRPEGGLDSARIRGPDHAQDRRANGSEPAQCQQAVGAWREENAHPDGKVRPMNRDSGAYSLTDLSDNAAPGATNDDRLDQALAEYLTLAQSGSSPDIPALLQKYDDVADKLAGCLKTLKFMHFVGESVSRAPDAKATPALMDDALGERPVNRTLGGHEIVREIGRGGMGVVYEAREIMLDRIVALKVLPFAALSDERHLKRFKNEARAAGTLDHPNIVAIHAVGSDRGIHYYTMKYIDGPTLAEVISALRSSDAEGDGEYLAERTTGFPAGLSASGDAPPVPHTRPPTGSTDTRREIQADLSTRRSTSKAAHYQTVARWGIEAAEALAYAHENGVLHRDIKPGNLLVDENGKLWVTDFGLARLEKDASMTMTGDIVGTLRYMAPEQALAKRIPIDHRTDVYSLGVTLYELLTLRPAITGDDRRELLKKIAFEDPPPPRKVDASIPIELETIVVKAMAKNPDERYCSAQELADDLQRYLDDKPIVARPPNLLDRTAKWARRHQSFVWTMLAVSALLIIGLSIGSILFANAAQRASLAAQLATHEKEEALRNLYRANVQIALNEWDDGRVDFALQHLAAVRPQTGRHRSSLLGVVLRAVLMPSR